MKDKLVEKYCAPKRFKTQLVSDTCFTYKELKVIAQDYNNSISQQDKKIKLNQGKQLLYEAIRERLSNTCDSEYCWIEQDFISNNNKQTLKNSFRPIKPKEWYKNKRTWLNTFDILDVMKQYEYRYKSFKFFGVYPMDFQSNYQTGYCIGGQLCDFNVSDFLKSDKNEFGFVLNLDFHNESGSHWVSVYCNLDPSKNNFGIYYYDSVANVPTTEMNVFSNKVLSQVKSHYGSEIADRFIIEYNKKQKQFKNTECGVFSMVFLTQMLKSIDFDFVCQHMKKDDDMNAIRDILYRPNMF